MSQTIEEFKSKLISLDEAEKKDLIEGILHYINKSDVLGKHSEQIERLKIRYNKYYENAPIKAGAIVRWKEGLRNRAYPEYQQPCIVLEVLDEPIFELGEDAGSISFREKLDVKIAFLDEEDGDFVFFHFDKNRFELWTSE